MLIRRGRRDPESVRGPALVAHEAVHVRDYARLGAPRFLARCARGLLAARLAHNRHPMELEAIGVEPRVRSAREAARP